MFQPGSVDRLNAIALPILKRLIADHGETESGAYNFYATRLRNGSIVGDYDIALVKAFIERGIGGGGVHEIGSGFGQLPMLLALNGIPAVAIELDRRRAPVAAMMQAALLAVDPSAGQRLRTIHGAFPLTEDVLPPSNAVLLSTNLVYTTSIETKAAICKAMTRYGIVVLDVDRLFDKHTDDAGRQVSFQLMKSAGFETPVRFLDLADSGRYFAFASRPTEEQAVATKSVVAKPLVTARLPATVPVKAVRATEAPVAVTASLAAARARLAARARARGVTRVVYFHTDHFEPWRTFDGRKVFGPENARDLETFANDMAKLEFGRKLTLFIKPHFTFALRRGADTVHATPDDALGFIARTPQDIDAARAALNPIIDRTGTEFQLHVHHENYTSNATNTQAGTEIGAYLATAKGAALDSARFEFAVRHKLDILQKEIGRSFARWFFIHGHWALNASDDKDCRIVDEISILHRLGCLGDFTCPAGRSHVDPRHHVPYLAKPVDVPKGYDTAEADPVPLAGAGRQLADSRFLVWTSAVKHGATSIDHSSDFVRRRGDDLEKAAGKLIDQSYLHAGTLYVKTHSHAMHPAYFDGRAPAGFPHSYGVTRDLLGLTFDAAADGGADIAFLTTTEVYDELVHSRVKSTEDLQAAFSSHEGGILQRILTWPGGPR